MLPGIGDEVGHRPLFMSQYATMLLPVLFFACGEPPPTPVTEGAPATPIWTQPGKTAAPPPDSDGTITDTVVTRPAADTVRLVALGDAGTGTALQYDVADGMELVCAARGCDFAIYLGDNFYDTGVDDRFDVQFESKFELPYANLSFPFYPALGNHDYGAGGAGYEFWRAPIYVEYTDRSDKWVFPAQYYRVHAGAVELFALDTNAMMWGFFDEQLAWMKERAPLSTAPWTLAYGHHPYRSNGPHGDAGDYDGGPASPIGNGTYVKEFMDQAVCGVVDMYLCGHDHSLQWITETCGGTELIVSGAGAHTTSLYPGHDTWYEDDDEGFVWIEADSVKMTVAFYDADGRLRYERTLLK